MQSLACGGQAGKGRPRPEPDVGGRNGIVTHTKGTWAATPEGRIVRMADQIAYVNHDIEDAVRARVLDPATLRRNAPPCWARQNLPASPP